MSPGPNLEGESSDNDYGIKGIQRKQGMRPNSTKSRNPVRVHISSSGERPISSAISSSRNFRVSNYLKSQGLQKKEVKHPNIFQQ